MKVPAEQVEQGKDVGEEVGPLVGEVGAAVGGEGGKVLTSV